MNNFYENKLTFNSILRKDQVAISRVNKITHTFFLEKKVVSLCDMCNTKINMNNLIFYKLCTITGHFNINLISIFFLIEDNLIHF